MVNLSWSTYFWMKIWSIKISNRKVSHASQKSTQKSIHEYVYIKKKYEQQFRRLSAIQIDRQNFQKFSSWYTGCFTITWTNIYNRGNDIGIIIYSLWPIPRFRSIRKLNEIFYSNLCGQLLLLLMVHWEIFLFLIVQIKKCEEVCKYYTKLYNKFSKLLAHNISNNLELHS